MNSAFLKQIEEENKILEQELQQLLRQEAVRFSFSQKRPKEENEDENDSENVNPNFRNEKGILSKIDEETEEEQPNRVEPHRLLESPYKSGPYKFENNQESIIDNLQDSINNYIEKRSSSIADIQSNRNSQKNIENTTRQIKSLEMRLSGTREALKSMEKEIKEKNVIIQNLQIDLAKKQKQIELLSKQSNNSSSTPSKSDLNNESFQEIKKQCKEWEKKYQECEASLKENKKYTQRLQELNQQLLYKLKQYESEKELQTNELDQQKNINSQIYQTNTSILNKYEQIIKSQQEQIQQEDEKYRQLERKYEELKINSEQFLLNSRDLKSQYEHMLNTLQSIANSY
ncbi:unnamed protein product [Paramecium sonneborni]|uniref:Uncharacterized protein n=1 Tax=Paramecium sonneborni TaxID=65129 RepID=A0A8S1KQV1_9CILI|nr:unnamed protein product [Paramecium sonneborni]